MDERSFSTLIDEATNLLAKFVVPLYEEDKRGRPSLNGSGFFVKAGEDIFLVSAAHVLETLKTKNLFYYIAPGITRKLTGKLLLNPWQGDREYDPIDVGVLKLAGEGLPPYPKVDKFTVDISYLQPAFLPREEKDYMIIGFPASRNGVNPIAREVASVVYAYHNYSIKGPDYCKHGLKADTHVALPLDLKVAFDSKGTHRHFPRPQGMSGSPIWVLFDENASAEERVFPLVGVGTKYRKKERLLVGTDIGFVLDMINEAV